MSNTTICPRFMFNYTEDTPEDIERYIMYPLSELLEEIKSHNIEIFISKHIMEKFTTSYPWDKSCDNQWKGYISNWYNLFLIPILKHSKLVSHDITVQNEKCELINDEINNIFLSFLHSFGTQIVCSKFFDNGIFTNGICKDLAACKKYQLINSPRTIHYVKYPWLPIYDIKLPFKGQYPFIPKKNWERQPQPIRGQQNGYLDNSNHEWKRDTLHDNHWDVQLSDNTGDYLNITDNGEIL